METLNNSRDRKDLFSDGFLSSEEEFVGEGEVNIIKTSATQTGMALNRLISDKDLFDTLFEMLENDDCGRVQVSKLIELTKDIMNGDFIELEMILDPMGCDLFVDLETFRTAVLTWEEKQKNSDRFYPQTSTPLNSSYKFNDSFDVVEELNSIHLFNSFRKDDKMDPVELETENSQLKFQNSKLSKEVDVMENQILALEETNNGLKNDVQSFRFKLQSCDNKKIELQTELDSLLIRSQEDAERSVEEKNSLQNEKNELDRQLKNVKDELNDTLKELSIMRVSEADYREIALEQEELLVDLQAKKDQAEEALNVKCGECDSFKENCLEALRNNERLRMTKKDLTEEISKLLEQHCLNQKQHFQRMMDDDISILSSDTNLDVTLDNTNIASTPFYFPRHGSSIFSELMDQNFEDSPSQPICGKSPAAIEINATIAWSSLENVGFMLERIQSELDEVNATELLERYSITNGNDDKPENVDSPKKREKDFETGGIDILSKLENEFNISEASPTSLSPGKLRDQINSQLRILRLQIAKSQSILTHLQSKSLPHVAKSTLNSPVQNEPDLSFSQFSLHNQTRTISRICGVSDSQNSTPLHHRIRTRSCPILPSETTFITKGTQTEPMDTTTYNTRLESSVKSTTTSATPVISITSDVDYDMENTPLTTRARTSSYSEAIKLGNRNSDLDVSTSDDDDDTRSTSQEAISPQFDLSQNPPKINTTNTDETDEDPTKKCQLNRLGSRRRRRSIGSTSNNNPSIQRVKAIDVEEEVDQVSCVDDSDVDVKSDILQGMNQANRRARSPSASSTAEITVSSSAKSLVSVETCEVKTFRRKSSESQKNRLLMPELMENSETESAKNSGGSMESETEQPGVTTGGADVVTPPPPCGDGPFPSLPDSFLKALQLHKSCEKSDKLNDKDVEAKFHSLLLAFKTDTFTLSSRLELHHRQRDIAEKNIDEEIVALKENLNALNQLCSDEDAREIIKRLHHHLEVLHQSTARMSSRAEVYGAVQQEDRTNRAIEVMLIHVENLKRIQEKATSDLEEIRRVMIENNLLTEDGSEIEDTRRNLRSYSMTSSSVGRQASKRRASIAALPRSTSERLDGRTKFINFVNTSRNSVCSIGSRQCSLYYNLKQVSPSDNVSPTEKLIKRHAADDTLVPSSSSVELSDDELAVRQRRPQSKKESIVSNNNNNNHQHNTMSTQDSQMSSGNDLIVVNEGMEMGTPQTDRDSHSMHCVSSWSPPVTSEYLTEPSEDDDVTDAPLFHSASRRTINMVDTASNLLALTTWVDNDHLFHGVRYTIGGLLLMAAFLSLLVAFFPGSTSAMASCQPTTSWKSLEEMIGKMIGPHLQLHHQGRPPL